MSRADYRAPVIEYLGGTEIGGGHLTGTVLQPASPSTFTTPALGIDVVILEEGDVGELFLVPPAIGPSQELLNGDHDAVYYDGCPAGPRGEILRRHGDEIARLPNGYFKAGGRVDDTMNLGGVKVGSVELERVVSGHVMVRECAAVAVRPEGGGAEKLVLCNSSPCPTGAGWNVAIRRRSYAAELSRRASGSNTVPGWLMAA